MPKYVYSFVFDAPDTQTALSIAGEADDKIGQFSEGSTPNGIAGVSIVGGGVVQVA